MARLLHVYHLLQLRYGNISISMRGNVDRHGDDCCELTGQVVWTIQDGQVFLVGRPASGEDGGIPWVTPFLFCHETNSAAFGFPGIFCSIHASDVEVLGLCNRLVQV